MKPCFSIRCRPSFKSAPCKASVQSCRVFCGSFWIFLSLFHEIGVSPLKKEGETLKSRNEGNKNHLFFKKSPRANLMNALAAIFKLTYILILAAAVLILIKVIFLQHLCTTLCRTQLYIGYNCRNCATTL